MSGAVSYQPWYVNQTFPVLDILLTTDAGPDDLTGVSAGNISMTFRAISGSTFTDTTGTGTFYIQATKPAEIYYKMSTTDVASAFSGELIIRIKFPPSSGVADEAVYDPIPFIISNG